MVTLQPANRMLFWSNFQSDTHTTMNILYLCERENAWDRKAEKGQHDKMIFWKPISLSLAVDDCLSQLQCTSFADACWEELNKQFHYARGKNWSNSNTRSKLIIGNCIANTFHCMLGNCVCPYHWVSIKQSIYCTNLLWNGINYLTDKPTRLIWR